MGQEKWNYPICRWTSILAHAVQTGPRCIQGHGARERRCNLLKRPVWEVRSGLGLGLIRSQSHHCWVERSFLWLALGRHYSWTGSIMHSNPPCSQLGLAIVPLLVSRSQEPALSGWAMPWTLCLFYPLSPSLKSRGHSNAVKCNTCVAFH